MVIKRLSNMMGSRHGANPFSRSSRTGTEPAVSSSSHVDISNFSEDSPEGAASRGVRLFCQSGGPENQGEEVLHLPTIVEAAESSPAAASVAAQQIRKFLTKDNYGTPHVQYNAIMLIRILADNPGATFTRNIDKKFTDTVKELLRNGRDAGVIQILRETLQALYMEKAYDTNLNTLFAMWSKESGMSISHSARAGGTGQGAWQQGPQQSSRSRSSRNNDRVTALPNPTELAARVEEAKTSAKLLQQLVQSTPANELQDNELIKEFAERCQNAQKSMQGFMNCSNPAPDDDTMQTLIETSEQLSLAASKHQRAVLQARRAGHTVSSPPTVNGYEPPAGPPPQQVNTGYSSPGQPPASTFTPNATHDLSSYTPPPGPPPASTYSPPPATNYAPPPATNYAPPPASNYTPPSSTAYSPPPLPSTAMRANMERRISGQGLHSNPTTKTPSPPPAASRGPPQLPPVQTSHSSAADYAALTPADNPFSDQHESPSENMKPTSVAKPRSSEPASASSYADDDDDPYREPGTSPHARFSSAASNLATLSVRPAPPRGDGLAATKQESWRKPDNPAGSPESYHPGFQSTPSYMHRQESSGDHFTMHGAGAANAPIEEERVVESSGRYGRVSPESPEIERRDRKESTGEVSPVESRYGGRGGSSGGPQAGPMGYRY